MTDRYSRFMLTVIALSLAVIAVKGLGSPVSVAHAADRLDCRIDGPIEIRSIGEIRSIRGEVDVEIKQAHAQPGTSSSYPVHVRQVD